MDVTFMSIICFDSTGYNLFRWNCKMNLSINVVLLPGFQKGRDINASQGKGQGAVLAKKGQFASYKEKLEKRIKFHTFLGQ
jgi:hypothetical protein